ncbi:DUF4783 domain-containing protein [Sphingobacterium sp. ML3W]|uniref:DUF4783 domain-containing protein n=2 Tax=Sphingobacterium TaxID=28453 RepID=UPI0009DDAA2C|nr:DUF4783 domain-containing protein [Sphingobacterium sp. ML3W]
MKKITLIICLSVCMFMHLFVNNNSGYAKVCYHSPYILAPDMSDMNDALLLHLRAGSAKNLARFFGSNVTLSILNEDGLYSKFQGEMLLQSFFSKNKPSTVKLLQKITNKTNYSYYVYQLTSNKNSFRLFVKVSLSKNIETIEEFRVEKQASK